jgi:hypothetical protein
MINNEKNMNKLFDMTFPNASREKKSVFFENRNRRAYYMAVHGIITASQALAHIRDSEHAFYLALYSPAVRDECRDRIESSKWAIEWAERLGDHEVMVRRVKSKRMRKVWVEKYGDKYGKPGVELVEPEVEQPLTRDVLD